MFDIDFDSQSRKIIILFLYMFVRDCTFNNRPMFCKRCYWSHYASLLCKLQIHKPHDYASLNLLSN